MDRKRTVVAAAAASAVLVVASTAFAATSGMFGSGRTDKVGRFEPVDEVLAPAPVRHNRPAVSGVATSSSAPTTSVAGGHETEGTEPPHTPGSVAGHESGDEPQPVSSSTVPGHVEAPDTPHDTATTSTRPEVDDHGSDDATTSTSVGNVPTTDDGGHFDD